MWLSFLDSRAPVKQSYAEDQLVQGKVAGCWCRWCICWFRENKDATCWAKESSVKVVVDDAAENDSTAWLAGGKGFRKKLAGFLKDDKWKNGRAPTSKLS